MTILYLVPNVHLRSLRRSLMREGDPSLVVTIPGLVAQILKEGLVSYKEDRILEEVAIWQCVRENLNQIAFFAPIAHFPGFIQELKWLFRQIDHGEDILTLMPAQGRSELGLLHSRYQEILCSHGILSAPAQIRRSVELAKRKRMLPMVDVVRLQHIELSPLEQELIDALGEGRSIQIVQPKVPDPVIIVRQARDPKSEVEMIGQALRRQIEEGAPLERVGVAFPNPEQYLPILLPVFEQLKIPWREPEISLQNTPLGKTILTLLRGSLEGWQKHHLELLTAPGWGFPLGLCPEERRLLRLAPSLRGLPAWREYLGQGSGWDAIFRILADAAEALMDRPLREFGVWLERLLDKLQPEQWAAPQDHVETWAELVKAWEGMRTIARSLKQCHWTSSSGQFLQLLESLFHSYRIQGKRVFADRVQILSIEQLGAYTYDQLYVGGLVEGQFPPAKNAHWLTKTRATLEREELYQRLTQGAAQVHLHYPEVDREGKLNLPATILPKIEDDQRELAPEPLHAPTLFLGKGFLSDDELLSALKMRILSEGLTVSQLNRYANCPYQFFCSHVLQLTPEEEVSLDLDAKDHGNLVHIVLQSFWKQHLEGPLPTIQAGEDRIEGLLRQAYAERGAVPANQLIRTMRHFIRHDLRSAEGGFRPKHLEKWFQALTIRTSFGPVEIRGRIDRIDQHPDGVYVLYDYKTGSAPQINAMLDGKDVQIAAYLLAAQTILPQGRNVGAAYYVLGDRGKKGIFHQDYKTALGVARGRNILDDASFQEQHRKFMHILQSLLGQILQGEFPIEPVSSRICAYCPFQGICRKEVGF